MNVYDDAIANGNELLGRTAAFGPGGTGLGEVALHSLGAEVRATAGKLGRLGPLDVSVKRLDRRIDVAAVKASQARRRAAMRCSD
jgi:hypothetical protein